MVVSKAATELDQNLISDLVDAPVAVHWQWLPDWLQNKDAT
tara:strand:+ start:170 stop:292 length:123 start_codon:yes stop_codon:yes gene_type:complete